METIFSFLAGSVYGWAIIGGPIYFIFKYLRKYIKILPDPLAITAIIMIPFIIYGMSYDRILFDKKISKIQKEFDFLKTYQVSYYGDIVEPMTWFNDYIGFIRLTSPADRTVGNYYTNFYFRIDQSPMKDAVIGETNMDAHDVDCENKHIQVSVVGKDGYMYIDRSKNFKMTEKDFEFYCLDDWSEYEKRAYTYVENN